MHNEFIFQNEQLQEIRMVLRLTPPMLTGRLSLLSRLSIAGPKPG